MNVHVPGGQPTAAAEVRIERLIWGAASVILAFASIALLVNLAQTTLLLGNMEADTLERDLLVELRNYQLLWFVLALAACLLSLFRRLAWLVVALMCILTIELMAHSLHSYVTGEPFKPIPPRTLSLFTPHPLLQGIPRPGEYGLRVHTDNHLRRTINIDKVPDPKVIAVYGGSTAYDEGIEDDTETWTSRLSELLGPEYAVENHGVPGYSTVEHLIQTLFDFRDGGQKCAVFYVGWNDLRNNNKADLKPDYSGFHLLAQRDNLGLTTPSTLLARRSALFSILQHVGQTGIDLKGEISHEYDQRLSNIYKQNIALIAMIAQHFGVKAIFVPQVLNYAQLTAAEPYGWMPFIEDRDAKKLMGMMNADLADAAEKAGSPFLQEVLQVPWTDADFVDNGHFNPQGGQKFASAIKDRVAAECR